MPNIPDFRPGSSGLIRPRQTELLRALTNQAFTSATLTDTTWFKDFTIAANQNYRIEGELMWDQTAATPTDIRMQCILSQTSRARSVFALSAYDQAQSIHGDSWTGLTVTTLGLISVSALDETDNPFIRLHGIVQAHATLDGTLKLQCARAGSGTMTLYAGSWMSCTRMIHDN